MKIVQVKEFIILILLSLSLFFSSINSLPVLDRDEARFVQASKQMIEESNYSSIKFQDEFRSKKPVGIYWLQAISINLLAKIKETKDFKNHVLNDDIWKYRIVSSLAALLSILCLYSFSKPIFNNKESFNASLLLASTLLFIAEAHIAKTDSVLLLLTIIAYLTLYKYFKGYKNLSILNFLLFWGSLGLSMLIKGPVLLIFISATALVLSVTKKDIKWIKRTKPIIGIILIITITFSWFFSMSYQEQKLFLKESLINDFLGKVTTVQEKHGAFPGAHTLSLWIFFFPFSIFFIPLITFLKNTYKDEKIFFLICWILPCLIIMEFIPTKLPHYILPIYPAIALAMSCLLTNIKNNKHLFFTKLAYLGYFAYFIVGNTLLILMLKAYQTYGEHSINIYIYFLVLFFCNNFVFLFIFKKNIKYVFFYLIIFANVFTLISYLKILPNLNKLWVSQNIYNILEKSSYKEKNNSIAVLGYNEPSLIFETATNTKVFYDIKDLTLNLRNYDYLIIEKDYYIKLNQIVNKFNLSYNLLSKLRGFNAAKGKWIEVYILKITK